MIQIQLYFLHCTQRNVYLKLAHVFSVGVQKYRWWPGLDPDPAGGAHDAPPDPSRTLRRSSRISVIKLWSPYSRPNWDDRVPVGQKTAILYKEVQLNTVEQVTKHVKCSYIIMHKYNFCGFRCPKIKLALYFYYPRDTMLARVIAIATCLSICLSVCQRRYCVKTKKASGMVSSLSGSPKTLVF